MQINEIDFVVTWVDGNDPQLNQRRQQYWLEEHQSSRPQTANPPPSQYANNNEIIYCLASILRNAPFARRIHVITDRQRPPLAALEDFGFNEAELAKISIVDHRDIFGDLADLAPTFNSLSIESLIHRTKGLADHFVYMNDDFFIIKPTFPSDYFAGPETPIVNGKILPYSRTYHRTKLWLLAIWGQKNRVRWSFLNGCMSAALACGLRFRYVRLDHSPRPMFRPILDDYFKSHPRILRENARHRFRHYRQFLPQALASCLSLQQGMLRVNSNAHTVGYVKPGRPMRFNPDMNNLKNLEEVNHLHPSNARSSEEMRFLCVQNLDQATEIERNNLLASLGAALTSTHQKDASRFRDGTLNPDNLG